HITFEHRQEMSSAIVFVQAPLSFSPTVAVDEGKPAPNEAPPGAMIDVRELIARTSIDDLNRTAEEYFSSLKEWEHHLAKPFAEPGPRHSRTPLSQFEMRTYGVIENDVDIHAIWRTARTCGFRDLKPAVFHIPPFHVSLDDYEDLLAGGPTTVSWVATTRDFL